MSELFHVIVGSQRADAFQQIFQNLKPFTESVTIFFETGRLFMQTMDSSHVSVVECVLPSSWFSLYDVTKSSKISLNVSLFSKVLATKEKGQDIVLQMASDADNVSIYMQKSECGKSECESGKSECEYERGKGELCSKSFDIPLFEMDQELLQIPETEYDAEFSLPSGEFAGLIQQLRIFGDTLDVECSETEIGMHSISQEKGKMRCKIDIDKLTSYSIVEDETVKTSFALGYLSHVCAFQKLSPQVDIGLKAETPIQITYLLNKSEGLCDEINEIDRAYMRFYLAPKIGDDDE